MRVAINCRSFSTVQYAGIGRYAFNLVKSLSGIDSNNRYFLYLQKDLFDFKRTIPGIYGKNFIPKIDRFHAGPGKTIGPVDIYHAPSPEIIPSAIGKIVVTVHDVIHRRYPSGHNPDTVLAVEKQFQDITQKADGIICCSKHTLNDMKSIYQVPSEKIHLVYQGVDKEIFCPVAETEIPKAKEALLSHGVTQPFILFVGTLEPRKNIPNLLRAFALLKSKNRFPGKLIFIGKKGWQSEEIFAVLDKFGLRNEVIFLGFVPDGQLKYFYNLAEAFVYPSLYEGFGFPIVEAMSCGCAVVTSQTTSCGEVAQDAALLVNPMNFEEIAESIDKVLSDKLIKDDLKRRSLKRAAEFSFQKTAQETLNVYEKVLKENI